MLARRLGQMDCPGTPGCPGNPIQLPGVQTVVSVSDTGGAAIMDTATGQVQTFAPSFGQQLSSQVASIGSGTVLAVAGAFALLLVLGSRGRR